MRGDSGRNCCGLDLIPSAGFEGSRELAAYSVVAAVKADWVLRGFVRTTSRATKLERVPPSPYFQSALLRNTPVLVAVCSGLSDGSHACVDNDVGAVPLPRPEVAGLGSHV
jgi:hypothetical protein